MSDLLVEEKNGVAYLTINRPAVRNAISMEVREAMIDALRRIETRPTEVRCVVLRGAGEHFCAGGDVKSFMGMVDMEKDERRRVFLARVHELHPIMMIMRRMPQPSIACVRGAAAGAGWSLAMNCDLVLAADDAFFTLAYVHIGASPDGSSTYFLPRMVGMKKAMELALLGERISAQEALGLQMVNRVYPAAQLTEETEKLAWRLAKGPTRAYANVRRLLNRSLHQTMAEQLQSEAECFADSATADDFEEGVRAFNEKRKAQFRGV